MVGGVRSPPGMLREDPRRAGSSIFENRELCGVNGGSGDLRSDARRGLRLAAGYCAKAIAGRGKRLREDPAQGRADSKEETGKRRCDGNRRRCMTEPSHVIQVGIRSGPPAAEGTAPLKRGLRPLRFASFPFIPSAPPYAPLRGLRRFALRAGAGGCCARGRWIFDFAPTVLCPYGCSFEAMGTPPAGSLS